MAAEQNRAIGYRLAEIWNHEKDLRVVDEIVDANFVSRSALPGLVPGREGFSFQQSKGASMLYMGYTVKVS